MTELNLGKVVGPQGPQGATGPAGAEGKQGPPGATGEAGKSAYQAARDGGYTGTEAEFNAIMAIVDKHAGRHKTGGADPLTAADVGAVAAELLQNKKLTVLYGDHGVIHNHYDDTVPLIPMVSNYTHYVTMDEAGKIKTILSIPDGVDVIYYYVANKGVWYQIATTDYALPRDGSAEMTGPLKAPHFTLTNFGAPLEIGQFIDFHIIGSQSDYDARLHVAGNGDLAIDERIILHTGNKPAGDYYGTGENDSYSIPCVGNAILIWRDTVNGAFAFVSGVGGIGKTDNNEIIPIKWAESGFGGGTLLRHAKENPTLNALINEANAHYRFVVL